ncbi:MAG: xanthine dehydrogenase family protein molybdopterin-binding subunit [Chloroflexi bacterium]|nr:xanthine dehydrogenase family protein molybdopterin-binding subunit [Chloroflexota bacterium]
MNRRPGTPITPLYASEKASGEAIYAGDVRLPGMLTGKFCRSPLPHARILNIDASRAEKLAGVKAVITSKDAPRERVGRWVWDRPILADGKVRHAGEAVAAVAADDEDIAQEAVSLIKVDYEELPVVSDPFEAMKPGATLVHDNVAGYQGAGGKQNSAGNILHTVRLRKGDAERALSGADIVHRESYSTPRVHQGFTQPHQVVAAVSPSGKLTVWDSTKAPFVIRRVLCEALGLPMARVRVIATKVGGDFGGKGTINIEPACVLLALKTGFPVKMVLDFKEEFTATFIRSASRIEITTGATRDGMLAALAAREVFDIGAYNDAFVQYPAMYNQVQGPYSIPNVDVEAHVVYTNNTPTGHCRAPRGPQQTFAIESHLDGLARKLGLDPLELRIRNVIKSGERLPSGGVVGPAGIRETMSAARGFIARNSGRKVPGEGWGVACGWLGLHHKLEMEGSVSTTWVKLNEDGTAILFTGCTEQGGGQHDILAQIVSQALGISPRDVTVTASDTDLSPYEKGTGGSTTTYRVGTSVKIASEDARGQLLDLAAHKLNVAPEGLRLAGGKIEAPGMPGKCVSLASICAEALTSARGPVVGIGEQMREESLARRQEDVDLLDELQTGTHVAKVAVDRETGKVRVLKYFASHDAGHALSVKNVEGQIDGGVVCGLGYALSEELRTEDGRTLNPRLTDYRMPRAGDALDVEESVVEIPTRHGPFGARGMGESPTVLVAAAINNAIYDAVGVRLTGLPLSSEKIVAALNGEAGMNESSASGAP